MLQQKKHRNMQSVNVCTKCRRINLHIQAVEAGYRICPECQYQENIKQYKQQ
jgi:hypothetical protein